jgi:hypothetical protein
MSDDRTRPDGEPQTMADAAEMLWVVLANVSGGDWRKQDSDWQEAAERWRDNYFAVLKASQEPVAAAPSAGLVERLRDPTDPCPTPTKPCHERGGPVRRWCDHCAQIAAADSLDAQAQTLARYADYEALLDALQDDGTTVREGLQQRRELEQTLARLERELAEAHHALSLVRAFFADASPKSQEVFERHMVEVKALRLELTACQRERDEAEHLISELENLVPKEVEAVREAQRRGPA